MYLVTGTVRLPSTIKLMWSHFTEDGLPPIHGDKNKLNRNKNKVFLILYIVYANILKIY